MKTTDKAWLAGFFDGEGTFAIGRKRPNTKHGDRNVLYVPLVSIANTDRRPIQWLKDNVGGSFQIYAQHKAWHKEYYRWQIYGKSIIPFVKMLLPYLKTKREQAEIVIALQTRVIKYKSKFFKGNRGKGCIPMNSKEIQAREYLYLRAKELNKKGKV